IIKNKKRNKNINLTIRIGDLLGSVYALLFLVMAICGFNVSALATLVANVPPITLTAYRVLVAGIGVLIISYVMGLFRLPTKKELKVIVIITIFNVVF